MTVCAKSHAVLAALTNLFFQEQGTVGEQTASTWNSFLKVSRGSGLHVPFSNLIVSVDSLSLLTIPDPPHPPPPIAPFSLPDPITHVLLMLWTVSLSLKTCLPYPNPRSISKAKEHSRVFAADIKQETGFQVEQTADYLRQVQQEHWPRLTNSFVCQKFSLLTVTGEDVCPSFSGSISAAQLMSPAYKEEDHVRLGKQNGGHHSFQPARKSCHHVAYARGPRLLSQGLSGQMLLCSGKAWSI